MYTYMYRNIIAPERGIEREREREDKGEGGREGERERKRENMSPSFTERMIVVSEWYDDNLENHIKSGEFIKPRPLSRLASQILEGLVYLSDRNMTHRSLSPDNVLLTSEVSRRQRTL